MTILAAERSFDQGLMALAEGRNIDAVTAFRLALEIEQQRDLRRPSARYLSYYGLSLARCGRGWGEAVEACRAAVEQEPAQPVYLLNLGRVYLAAGRRSQAFECFSRGVALAPTYRPLLEELERLDRSTRPTPFGSERSHVIDRVLGRARAGWQARAWRSSRRRSA